MKQLITSLTMFIASFVLLIGVVFAWFTMTNETEIRPFGNSIIERDVNIGLEYGINGGSYFNFNEPAEINSFLNNMIPGDTIDLRVTVENTNAIGAEDMTIDIMLNNIRSTDSEIEYNLTDFFYIYAGIITVTWYDNLADYMSNTPLQIQQITLNRFNQDAVDYLGHPLEMDRLSNLMVRNWVEGAWVVENNIEILNTTFSSGQFLVIEFSIGFDPYTPDEGLGFQNGELLIDGLYTFFGDEE
jgi:hypothetical protein